MCIRPGGGGRGGEEHVVFSCLAAQYTKDSSQNAALSLYCRTHGVLQISSMHSPVSKAVR